MFQPLQRKEAVRPRQPGAAIKFRFPGRDVLKSTPLCCCGRDIRQKGTKTMTFQDLGLTPQILSALRDLGYEPREQTEENRAAWEGIAH